MWGVMARSGVRQGMLEQRKGLYSGLTATSSVITMLGIESRALCMLHSTYHQLSHIPSPTSALGQWGVLRLVRGNDLSSREPSCRKVSLENSRGERYRHLYERHLGTPGASVSLILFKQPTFISPQFSC